MKITDINGHEIEVADLHLAIMQADDIMRWGSKDNCLPVSQQ